MQDESAMSGSLSRSVSLSPVEAAPTGSQSSGVGSMPPYPTKATNGGGRIAEISISPLKIFVLAKKKINDVFAGLHGYIQECHSFVIEMGMESEVASQEQLKELDKFKSKISGISDVLQRDHMKVVFFGRTSNGKSTVINAMLQDKILPSGLGHTTNCFLQVEGSENDEAYLLTEDSAERKNVKSVTQLAHALNSEKLGESTQVRIIWPKDKCPLLRDDVVLVDSPGIDVSPNLDEWIDKYCLDADVFVLVANAESTLMLTEKNFFHKVNERLSKPNIFILNNRWDASASEPEYSEGVRKQHLERNISFLVDELHVVSRQQAEDRVFFVSAKEVLLARVKQQQGLPPHSGALAEGFQTRFFEFQDFERKFEECLSKSAVKTKFEQHAQRGTVIIQNVQKLMDMIFNKATDMKKGCLTQRKEQKDRLEFTVQQLELLTEEVKLKIGQLVEQVEQKVSSALSEEIRKLSVLVNDFERPFHPDSLVLSVYKKELHSHVEQGLSSNLRSKLSSPLALTVERAQKDMAERMSALLPMEHRPHLLNILSRHNFEILYRLNCESLCSEFKEDLNFHFSLGLVSLVSRFLGPRGAKMTFGGGGDTIPRPIPSTPQTPSNEVRPVMAAPPDYLAIVQKMAMLSPTSQTAVGTLAISGFLVKSVGWRIIALTLGVYGLLYTYERLTWTNKAKERSFKKQYVSHATHKLRLIVDLTSANCSHQVQQELSSTYARLCHLVDDVANELQVDIRHLDQEINKLESTANNARRLKNKAGFLSSELDTFCQQYLHYDN